jgi:uncharacterized protein (DUF983 family)
MALVLCPECGEEALAQLVSCPSCDEPLVTSQKSDKTKNTWMILFSLVFIGGLGAATMCNMTGYTGWAMWLGMVGIASMAALLLNLNADR